MSIVQNYSVFQKERRWNGQATSSAPSASYSCSVEHRLKG